MKLAVVGVTGMVGQEILKVLKESDIKIDEFIPVASERSTGKKLVFDNKEYIITGIQNAIDQKPDITIFSAGGNTSLEWAENLLKLAPLLLIIRLHGEWMRLKSSLFLR